MRGSFKSFVSFVTGNKELCTLGLEIKCKQLKGNHTVIRAEKPQAQGSNRNISVGIVMIISVLPLN